MIGIDTNILLRWIIDDTIHTSERLSARRALEGKNVYVSLVVLVEFLWLLRQTYRRSRQEVHDLVTGMLEAENLILQHRETVVLALSDAGVFGDDIADHLIGRLGESDGCDYTLTFDRKASRSPMFRLLAIEAD